MNETWMTSMKNIFFTLLLLIPLSAQAEIYKWTDEQGNTHYGDKPVSQNVEQLKIDSTPSPVKQNDSEKESRDEMRQRVSDSLETDRLAKKEERKKKQAERNEKRRDCNRLRDIQKRYKKAGNLYDLDKKGGRVTLSAEQRKKSERRLQQRLNKACR